jgi:adenylate kinase family enzyme
VRRIAIIGPAGSGKSRLARELSAAIGVRVVYLDRLFWKPGWVETPPVEWEAIQQRELTVDAWIADGLQEGTEHLWLDAAEVIVFLDASPMSCVWRVARRRLDSEPGPESPVDCLAAPIYRAVPKFLGYLWRYRRTTRPEVLSDLARRRGGAQEVVVVRNARELRAFLQRAAGEKSRNERPGELS